MKVGLGVDNTIPLHVQSFSAFINTHAKSIHCSGIKTPFRFSGSELEYEIEVEKLSLKLRDEAKGNDITLLVTTLPFANNFFYTGLGGLFIVSLSDWHLLTSLPMSNGLAFQLCQIISKHYLHIGQNHDVNTFCINDFCWDKTGIDVGMRAAFICEDCRAYSADNPHLASDEFADVVALLNAISLASRRGVDILSDSTLNQPIPPAQASERFDVFLCHNSQDKPAVKILDEALRNGGIRTWLDDDQVKPGQRWQHELEKVIPSVAACLVIIGESGFGPWQDNEQRVFVDEFTKRGCRIILVLIGGETAPPELPVFLRQFRWSDLRNDDGRELARIITALRS